jgi:hypothetical protein
MEAQKTPNSQSISEPTSYIGGIAITAWKLSYGTIVTNTHGTGTKQTHLEM